MDSSETMWMTEAFRFLKDAEKTESHQGCRVFHIQSPMMECHFEAYRPYPFAEVAFIHARGRGSSYSHECLEGILQLNLCQKGRLGWQMSDGSSQYLGAGDVSIHRMDACPLYGISLPWEQAEDVMVLIDLAAFAAAMPESLKGIRFDFGEIQGRSSAEGGMALLPLPLPYFQFPAPRACWSADHRLNYVRLKFQELLLILHANAAWAGLTLAQGYPREKVERIQAVHDYLTGHLAEHLTVREVSRRFFINLDDLKKGFKFVYGMPPAQYMRSYRMKKAAELLCRTTLQVQEIADRVGYGHPGKFALVFRERMHMSPSAYRKANGRSFMVQSGRESV
ncbi:MAG: helix-turn-helix transcriptional regulator [Desulfovibrionaceae bacterium]|nr:helix-turn-helix transcriptional regulator [Desulfovibrionaceae bacterium]